MEDLLREYEELYLRHIEVLNRLEELEAEIKARARAHSLPGRGRATAHVLPAGGALCLPSPRGIREVNHACAY